MRREIGIVAAFAVIAADGVFADVETPKVVAASVDLTNRIGTVGKELYGGFIEHLGRNVYGGVYDPDDPQADEDGFRRDVIREMKELKTPIFRYPGGCFTDFWRWEDGIGPREKRPVRIDPYWKQLDDNSFGLDEFMKWIGKVGAEPMITFNLSNRGLLEAERMWEYLRFPKGTTLSEMRRKYGRDKPYDIRYWCLGNEIYGSWEMGNRDAASYGRDAREVAKFLKHVDKDAIVVLCGCEWDQRWNETVLSMAWKYTDLLSIHMGTWQQKKGYDRSGDILDRNLEATAETIRRLNSKKPEKERRNVKISIDEYFLWNGVCGAPGTEYTKGRHILEPDYTILDSVVMGDLHITMHNHADMVAYAGIAQSVNAIAPIRTEKNGRLWHQTIYDPLRLVATCGIGEVLRLKWSGNEVGDVRASAILRKDGSLAVFVVNRSLTAAHDFVLSLPGAWKIAESKEQSGPQNVANALDREVIRARDVTDAAFADGKLSMPLKACSWRMIVLEKKCDGHWRTREG